jgi:hypothetical protein
MRWGEFHGAIDGTGVHGIDREERWNGRKKPTSSERRKAAESISVKV